MNYTRSLTLDVSKQYDYSYVRAKQGDDASRFLIITMTADGEKLTPPTTATAVFRALKPDGKSIYNPATINSDGTITVELTEQVLAVPGRIVADVSVTDDGAVLSATSFYIDCLHAPLGETINSESEMLKLNAALDKVDAAVEAEAARVKAEAARVTAENARAEAEEAREAASAEAVTNAKEATAALTAAVKQVVLSYDETQNAIKCTIYKEES